MKKFILLTMLFMAALTLHALDAVRVDVRCPGGMSVAQVSAEGLSVATTPAQATENITNIVLMSGNLNDQWQKFEFTFTPAADGRIALRFHTPGSRNVQAIKPVLIDDVQVIGGTLLNGSFEIVQNNRPANWGFGKNAAIITGELVYDGERCVRVIFNSGMATQIMIVTGGEKVTVSFRARLAQ